MPRLPAHGNALAAAASPGGGTGIRSRLKICRSQGHEGSIPSLGTRRLSTQIEAEFESPISEDLVVDIAFEGLRDFASVAFGVIPFARGWTLIYRSLPPNEDCDFGL